MRKAEITEVQILRGISFLAIVMQHALAIFAFYPNLQKSDTVLLSSLLALSRYAVPMFVFITGMVLFYNYSDGLNYPSFIKKRIKDILVPYFLWACIFYIIFHFSSGFSLEGAAAFLKAIFNGTACYHLWYIIMIFQFYLLLPLFIFIIKDRKYVPSKLFLPVTFLLYAGLLWASSYYIPTVSGSVNQPVIKAVLAYRDRNFLLWFFYFIMGAFAGMYIDLWKRLVFKVRNINIFFYLGCLGFAVYKMLRTVTLNPSGQGYTINFNASAPLEPFASIFAVSAIILLFYIAQKISEKKNLFHRLFYNIGKYSFGSYLIHPLILSLIGFAFSKLGILTYIPVRIVLYFVICSGLSYLLTVFFAKLPFFHLLAGTKRGDGSLVSFKY